MSIASELEFDADRWKDMPQVERVRRCLMFAHEARQLASTAGPDVKESYADLAKQWLALAAEIEKASPAAGRLS